MKKEKMNWSFYGAVIFFIAIIILSIYLFRSPANITNLVSGVSYGNPNMMYVIQGQSGMLLIEVKNNEKITLSPIVSLIDDEHKICYGWWCGSDEYSCMYLENTQLEEITPKHKSAYLLTIKVKNETRCEDGQTHPITITIRDINGGKFWDTEKFNVVIPHRLS